MHLTHIQSFKILFSGDHCESHDAKTGNMHCCFLLPLCSQRLSAVSLTNFCVDMWTFMLIFPSWLIFPYL